METYKLKTKNGKLVNFEGTQKGKVLELSYKNKILCAINAHKDDLDTIQKNFIKLDIDEMLENVDDEKKELSPIEVINGLDNIMKEYPETKGRLASLKSQVYNVLKKYSVLD